MAESVSVYTIGHSNHSLDRFLDLLSQHQVETIVDVRSVPYSRFAPHFNGNAIKLLLEQHGIQYVYAGKFLGGRPTDPSCYKTGAIPEGKVDYLNLVDYPAVARQPWYQRGIRRLLEIATTQRTAIMCSEENPRLCHRHHLIEISLHEQGVSVIHIRRDGNLESLPPETRNTGTAAYPQLALAGLGE